MAKSFANNNIRNTSFDAFNLSFQTDMVRYQVEDKLNKLFCTSMGITLDELISMQNDENMDRLNELIARFNEFANYDRYSAAIESKKIFINHFEYKIIHKIKIFYRKDLYERINRGREKELFRMVRR